MEFLEELNVKDLLKETVQVDRQEKISKVIGKLLEEDRYQVFTCLPDGQIYSLSLREILETRDISNQKVSSIASPVPTLDSDDKAVKAIRLMFENRLRVLPVVDNHNRISEVDVQSILKSLEFDSKLSISKLMTPHPTTLFASELVSKAKKIMVDLQVDHIPIVDEGKIISVVTSKDLISIMYPPSSPRKGPLKRDLTKRFEYPLRSLSSTHILAVDPTDKASTVLLKMLQNHMSYALILVGDELQGITTYRDFIQPFYRSVKPTVAYIAGMPKDDIESEGARYKFVKAIESLKRIYPNLIESRAVVKSSKKRGERRLYEVSVIIKTTDDLQTFKESNWSLIKIFNLISSKIKRVLAKNR